MDKLNPDTETMLRFPMGAVSPLWLMFAGAATAGAAFFWAKTFFRPTNLEALAETTDAVAEGVTEVVEEVADLAEALVEDVVLVTEETLEVATEVSDEILDEAPEAVQDVIAALALEPVAAPAAPAAPDDLTRLTGIGPKLALALAERGVTRFADIAAWSAEDVARFDKDLKLMGRVEREAWQAQARRFAEAAVN